MIRMLIFCCALAMAMPALAQLKEGKVVYERTIQLQMRIQGMDPAIANNLPRSRTDRFELSFTPTKTLWEALPDMDDEGQGGGGGGGMMMRFGNDEYVYTDLQTGLSVARQELADKKYLVTDSLRKLSWKLTDETKTILGYKARKAVANRYGTRFNMSMENGQMKRTSVADTTQINAWFTTEIPVSAGPEMNGQLPGLVLELEMNKGRVVYKATEVSQKVNASNIKEPKGGKAMTATDFNQERNKVFEEMRRNMPAGGRGGFRVQVNQ